MSQSHDPTFDYLLGLSEEEADAELAQRDLIMRISGQDGRPNMGTADFRRDRVNVWMMGGKIEYVSGIG